MKIVWDEPKRRSNLATHVASISRTRNHSIGTPQSSCPVNAAPDGRQRFRAIGWLGDELVTVVFSPLGTEAISVISVRAASRNERKLHDEET